MILDEGENSFGVKIESANFNWFAWDNAVLYYYGAYEPMDTVVLADNYYTTFSSNMDLDFSDFDELRAFIAIGYNNQKLFLKSVKKVPAGTGLLLKGEAGSYEIPEAEGDLDDVSDNMLVGVQETTTISTLSGNYANYYFVKENANTYFSVVTDDHVVEAGSAYLHVPALLSLGAKAISIGDIDNQSTAIETVDSNNENDVYYTLQGIRVAKPQPGGVYIFKGQKLLFK